MASREAAPTAERSSLERRLAAFLPRFERAWIASWTSPPTEPEGAHGEGAMLLADLAGFTALTRRLGEGGVGGAERLSEILDGTFGRMVGTIEEHGGDVVLFAGDALLAMWRAEDGGDDLEATVLRAAACGLRVLSTLDGLEPEAGVRLRLRASVTAGRLELMRVGGVDGRWRFVVSGDAVTQLADTDAAGTAGALLLSGPAAKLGGSRVSGEPAAGGALVARTVDASARGRASSFPAVLPPLEGLRSQVPRAIVHRLEAGQDDWLGEFRGLSLLFAGMEQRDAERADVQRLHAAVRAMQEGLARYRGSIYSLAADDKGTSLIAAFGMPPLAVQEPAARALGAALEMRDALEEAGVACSIGVTTGRVFCGAYGGLERRHYAVVGPPINLAARLMKAARGGVLCDDATREAAGDRVTFGAARSLRLKGFDEPVAAHPPLGLRTARVRATERVVGRERELAVLDRLLESAGDGGGGAVVVEGPAGLGKSTLLGAFVGGASGRGVRVLSGGGDALRASSLYFAWRAVLEQLLPGTAEQRADAVREILAGDERLLRWAPLLSSIVPVAIPDNETSREITGEARALSVQELVVRILEHAGRRGPLVLLLEDAHWFDGPSHALIHAVARRLPSLAMVVSTRPHEGAPPPEYAAFRGLEHVRTLALEPLRDADIPELVALALAVDRVPDELVAFLRRQAECHPFHTTELARSLRDRGLVEVADGTCRIRTESGGLEGVQAPASVQEVVLARVDGLGAEEQLILKAASVIGVTFPAAMLGDVFPLRDARVGIPAGLESLIDRDMIRHARSPSGDAGTFEFRHAIIQDVVYGSLLFAQRRELHRAVAEWYELDAGVSGRSRAPLLAHHWDRAEVPERALGYLEAAGAEAVAAFSNRDAVRFLSRAVELDEKRAAEVSRARRAEWERNLAEARIRLSDYDRAREHLLRALADRRLRVHRRAPALAASLLWHVLVQMVHRLVPSLSRVAGAADADRRAHGARVYKRVAEVAYFQNDKLRLLHATLAALNMAESCGAVPEQVNGYGSIAIVADLGGMETLAGRYMARAIEVAERAKRPAVIGRAHLLALIRAVTRGNWEAARASGERSREMFRRVGDAFRWETCTATWGYAFLAQGDLETALELFEEAAQSARHGSPQAQTWARVGQLIALLDAGREFAYVAGEVERLLEAEHQSRTEQLTCSGVLALARLREGHFERAREFAAKTLTWLGGEAPAVYYPLWSIAGTAEVCLAGASQDEEAAAGARAATRVLRAHGKMFPICVPVSRRIEGHLALLEGRPERARALWTEGARAAGSLGMRIEAARLERALEGLDGAAPPPEKE